MLKSSGLLVFRQDFAIWLGLHCSCRPAWIVLLIVIVLMDLSSVEVGSFVAYLELSLGGLAS